MMTSMFSFMIKIHFSYKPLLKRVQKTPHPHTHWAGASQSPAGCRGRARLLLPLLPPTWPDQPATRLQHGGVQGLKPHVWKSLSTWECKCGSQFPLSTVSSIPSTLPEILAGPPPLCSHEAKASFPQDREHLPGEWRNLAVGLVLSGDPGATVLWAERKSFVRRLWQKSLSLSPGVVNMGWGR